MVTYIDDDAESALVPLDLKVFEVVSSLDESKLSGQSFGSHSRLSLVSHLICIANCT